MMGSCDETVELATPPLHRPPARKPIESPLSHTNLRRAIRLRELALAQSFFGRGKRLLEVGAGAGWQANALTQLGYSVTALEVAGSNYVGLREFPIREYDGRHIPSPNDSFDIIFSSNVLEHIPHISEFHVELWRVLRPGGVAVHIMPTATWRLWTNVSFVLRRALQFIGWQKSGRVSGGENRNQRISYPTPSRTLRQALLPSTHGARGNWCTEMWYFSEFFWRRTLHGIERRPSDGQQEGWHVEGVVKNRLFYTGNKLCGERLSLRTRAILSRFLGSSCKLYIVRKVLRSSPLSRHR